jgi:hypothetical protein
MLVLHKCDNPACVNIDHLYLGTQKDNMRDRKERGRDPVVVGELNPNCKLTDLQISKIRSLEGQKKQAEIAEMFGVSQPYVSKILRGVNRG